MSLSIENILLLGSVLLFLSIVASKTSFTIGVPALIFFLVVGMLAGSDGPGGIYFNDPQVAQFLGVVALTLILFSGGLETKWESVQPVLKSGMALSTIGVVITAAAVGLFTSYLLDFTIAEGLLVGAIVSSTDAAAVFSILRTRNIGLKGNVRPLLELESGSNDPMAYFLTISLIFLVKNPDASLLTLVPKFFRSMVLGLVAGYAFGKLMIWVVNKIRLDIEGLYPVLVLSLVFFTFSFTDSVGGNGFLAVYIAAIQLGNSNFIHKKSLIRFYDGQAWLVQIIMFLTLGLLVFPSQIVPIIDRGVLISLFLIFIARPLAVFLSLFFSRDLNNRKKLFISWVGLRGAVPIIFATYAMLERVPHSSMIFNLVFFISVSSVLVQGTMLPLIAKLLHVSVPASVKRRFAVDLELGEQQRSALIELDVEAESAAAGKQLVELRIPPNVQIIVIRRKGKYLNPTGDTMLLPGDHLLVTGDNERAVEKMREVLGVG